MRVRLIPQVREVPAAAWDALVGDSDPFVEHAFLDLLEQCGAVGPGTGWLPAHVTVWDGEGLVGALPLYEKRHSYGEFVFDWGWADAAARAGIPYYPKLVSMVPVTPATGRRLLVHPEVERSGGYEPVVRALIDGAFEARAQTGAGAIQILFMTETEARAVASDGRLLPRLSYQFHWHNAPYASFDAFVECFRSSMRKKLRRERRVVAESGVEVRVLSGGALGPEHWRALGRFYRDTCATHGSPVYLPPAFFELAPGFVGRRAVAPLAYRGGHLVAGALAFERGSHLYGRYWGCDGDYEMLHFELCYYRLIERAIARGMTRFEAGAQGTHKLRRGLMPSAIHNAVYIHDPALRGAVTEFLDREAAGVRAQMAMLADHGPFRRAPRDG